MTKEEIRRVWVATGDVRYRLVTFENGRPVAAQILEKSPGPDALTRAERLPIIRLDKSEELEK